MNDILSDYTNKYKAIPHKDCAVDMNDEVILMYFEEFLAKIASRCRTKPVGRSLCGVALSSFI